METVLSVGSASSLYKENSRTVEMKYRESLQMAVEDD
jgi:hypothetical protein